MHRRKLLIVVLAALVVIGVLSPAQAGPTGSNERIAFTWSHEEPQSGVSNTDLGIVGADGTNPRNLTYSSGDYGMHYTDSDWSPNGRKLVAAFSPDESPDLLVILRGDNEESILTLQEGFLGPPVFSPDGKRIAFLKYTWPRRAPDYTADIWTVRSNGRHLERLTKTKASESDLDWSSRDRIVFSRAPRRFGGSKSELFMMRPNGRQLRRLTKNSVKDVAPAWSPEGRRLLWTRQGVIVKRRLYGTEKKALSSGTDPAWSPDGKMIAFTRQGELWTMTSKGQDEVNLGSIFEDSFVSGPDWRP